MHVGHVRMTHTLACKQMLAQGVGDTESIYLKPYKTYGDMN